MPTRKRVGILTGKYTELDLAELKRLMRKLGLEPRIENVSQEREIGIGLKTLLAGSDVLLTFPDPSIYNKHTVLNILLSSYRSRVPVVGFSAAYVKAGAVIAVYSTPSDIGRHMGEKVGTFLTQGSHTLTPAAFPRYFSISINKRVADSQKIRIPGTDLLKSKIMTIGR